MQNETPSISDGDYKFNNCQFKSNEEVTLEINRCGCEGGNTLETGYLCKKRNLFKIGPEICLDCWEFLQKEKSIDEKNNIS